MAPDPSTVVACRIKRLLIFQLSYYHAFKDHGGHLSVRYKDVEIYSVSTWAAGGAVDAGSRSGAAAGGPSVYLSTHANWPELRMSARSAARAQPECFQPTMPIFSAADVSAGVYVERRDHPGYTDIVSTGTAVSGSDGEVVGRRRPDRRNSTMENFDGTENYDDHSLPRMSVTCARYRKIEVALAPFDPFWPRRGASTSATEMSRTDSFNVFSETGDE
ncbi:hypothetical protein EVAR_101298_1 [Eumeta japonica]|uniref:Uncharacterized protein n=1 Tax=Eumeta variegata TaxID=151549 RepID=A0A4C1SLV4_EUMVA|nr:hypothetical protein EVAR_101298_1 [Eumeta japonica]